MAKTPRPRSLIELPEHKHCGLCLRTVKLCESHIIAAYMGEWMPDLTGERLRVGVNWSGPRATGYDMTAEEVVRNVGALIEISLGGPAE